MTRAALPLLVLTFSSKRTEAQALGLVAFAATLPALLFSLRVWKRLEPAHLPQACGELEAVN